MQTASRRVRFGLLVVLFAAELLSITARYEVPALPSGLLKQALAPAWLFQVSKEFWQVALWIAASCFLLLTPKLSTIADDLLQDSDARSWWRWLGLHAIAFAAFAVLTALIFGTPTAPGRLSMTWFSGWVLLAALTLVSWLLAVASGRFWWRVLHRERSLLLFGCLLGVGAWMLMGMLARQEAPLGQIGLWSALSRATLELVHAMLGVFYADLLYDPDRLLVGTASFPVEVTYACSGIEGVSLISVFLAIYLWLFRAELRFPQVLWLFPFGIAAAWLANAVRIALLIAIGTSVSPEVALQGFHAQAGWVTFAAIAIGAITLSHRLRFFSIATPGNAQRAPSYRLAIALLAPWLVLLAISMFTAALSSGVDWFYPLRVVAAAVVLWCFRDAYRGLGWTWSWQAPAIGVAVFVVWMLLEPPASATAPAALGATSWIATTWLMFRVIGSIVVVPLAEELAFRGYLLRKLVKRDFECVPLTHFTWLSFALSSILFGLLHGRWLAGTIAGMAYALAVYRRGQLGDAVLAHATTNALIAAWVIATGTWSLWGQVGN
jgi:exosortase E/protease (VPEID-CTERM system)